MSSESSSESIPLQDVVEGIVNVKLLKSGKRVVVIRRGERVRVFHENCPHMGADLAEARYCPEQETLHCKWHGYVFNTDDGRFLENPNEKLMKLARVPSKHWKPGSTPRYRLALISSTVKDGLIFIGRPREPSMTDGAEINGPLPDGGDS